MNYVDFEEVVAESVATIGYVEDQEVAKNFCKQWIWRALQKLGIADEEMKVSKIYVKNLLIKKPLNMRKFEEIALYDANDCFIPHVYHKGTERIYPNVEVYNYNVTVNEGTDEEETITYTVPVDLSDNKTSFVLGTNGTMVEYALVRYYASPLDADGLPVIREDEVEALTAFCRYQWSKRKNENQSEIQQNRITWLQEADWAKAQKKVSSTEEKKQMASLLTRMLPNFNRSRF